MATIGLTMIVKNEAHVIRRALDSTRPFIDYLLISDTGSTDGTPAIIRSWLEDNRVPGEVIERPWVDFSHNRNEALDRLSGVAGIDYVLTIDADEYLVLDAGFDLQSFKHGLSKADGWRVTSHLETQRFDRLQLFSNRMPFRFHYKMHEKVRPPADAVIGKARGFYNEYTFDGARTRNPRKYLDDARVIERELAIGAYDDDVTLDRYTYYLGQCYNWGGAYKKARKIFLRHTQMAAPPNQISSSYFNIAQITEELGESPEAAIAAYLKSYEFEPRRSDPLCAAARLANIGRLHHQAYLYAKAAVAMPEPDIWTFDVSAFEWRALDELLVAAIGTSRFSEAVEVAERLLSEGKFPESERQRIETNAAYALAQYDLAPRPEAHSPAKLTPAP